MTSQYDPGIVRVTFETICDGTCARLARVASLCERDPDIIVETIALHPNNLHVSFYVVSGTSKAAALARIERAWCDPIATAPTCHACGKAARWKNRRTGQTGCDDHALTAAWEKLGADAQARSETL